MAGRLAPNLGLAADGHVLVVRAAVHANQLGGAVDELLLRLRGAGIDAHLGVVVELVGVLGVDDARGAVALAVGELIQIISGAVDALLGLHGVAHDRVRKDVVLAYSSVACLGAGVDAAFRLEEQAAVGLRALEDALLGARNRAGAHEWVGVWAGCEALVVFVVTLDVVLIFTRHTL